MVATHFSGNAIKIEVLEDFEKKKKKRFFGEKWWNYFLPVFKAPQHLGVNVFWPFLFFFFIFSVSSASSKRVCKKKLFL